MVKFKKHKEEVYRELVILLCGYRTHVYSSEMKENVFSTSRMDQMNELLNKMRREGFIKKSKSVNVYWSLTERGQRHYFKILSKMDTLVWST